MVYVTTLLYALLVLPLRIAARVDIGERSTVKLRLQALFFTLQFDGVVERMCVQAGTKVDNKTLLAQIKEC